MNNIKIIFKYIMTLIKWILSSVAVGIIGGIVGSLFHLCLDAVTELRYHNSFLIFLLPIGGVLITAMYSIFKAKGPIDTNRVIEAIRSEEKIPLVMAPLIFIGTALTHMLGGSAGREGAALQLGGSIGYNFGRMFRLKKNDIHIIIMAGMSAVFAALFGTPLTAAVFSLEVASVGILHYAALLPCVVSSITAVKISHYFNIQAIKFANIDFGPITWDLVARVIILAALCALVGILFCIALKKSKYLMSKFIKNEFLRAILGGAVIVLLTMLLRTYDYNGAGMNVVERAISGEARPEAFLLKIIFTAVTIAAGFKGGEIVPTFFIGATFGCTVSGILGLEPSVSAAIGFVALFCAVVNCPIASILLSIEIFGSQGILCFAVACAVSYMMSGNFGLYHNQKIVYSKLDDEYIDIKTI